MDAGAGEHCLKLSNAFIYDKEIQDWLFGTRRGGEISHFPMLNSELFATSVNLWTLSFHSAVATRNSMSDATNQHTQHCIGRRLQNSALKIGTG